MVIHNLDMAGTGGVPRPLEANPPLLVNADRVLHCTVAPQRFQAIAWQTAQVVQACGGGQDFESLVGLPVKTGKFRHALARRKLCRSLIPKTQYHTSI